MKMPAHFGLIAAAHDSGLQWFAGQIWQANQADNERLALDWYQANPALLKPLKGLPPYWLALCWADRVKEENIFSSLL